MADHAVRTVHAHHDRCSEYILVVVDGFRCALDHKIRRNVVVSFGNVIDFAHNILLIKSGWRLRVKACGQPPRPPSGNENTTPSRTQALPGAGSWLSLN